MQIQWICVVRSYHDVTSLGFIKRVYLKMLKMCLFVVWLIAGTIACRLPKAANEFIDFLFVPAAKKHSHLV